jgi:hypothetical protein
MNRISFMRGSAPVRLRCPTPPASDLSGAGFVLESRRRRPVSSSSPTTDHSLNRFPLIGKLVQIAPLTHNELR